MALPKKKHNQSRRNRRRSHHALKKPNLALCSHCGKLIFPHRVCPFCGYYKNQEVVDIFAKLDKKERKKKEKEIKEEQKETQKKPLTLEGLSKKS